MTKPIVSMYLGLSIDGMIAGVDGDLSWLALPDGPHEDDTVAEEFAAHLATCRALVMGRATYDAVAGFDIPWPYGDLPVLVATTRTIQPSATTVTAASGDAHALLEAALQAARAGPRPDARRVYVDGGRLAAQFVQAGLVDEMILTTVPVVLGDGIRLAHGATGPVGFRAVDVRLRPTGSVTTTYVRAT